MFWLTSFFSPFPSFLLLVTDSRRSQKLICNFSRKDTTDEILSEGGAEAKVREEVCVAGSDEGQVGESADQSVEVVVNITVAEGRVVGGDQVGGIDGQ